jgi:hypothetical protein
MENILTNLKKITLPRAVNVMRASWRVQRTVS